MLVICTQEKALIAPRQREESSTWKLENKLRRKNGFRNTIARSCVVRPLEIYHQSRA